MRLIVSHRTQFYYKRTASLAMSRACLTPRDTVQQRCLDSRLVISPVPDSEVHADDRFGNAIVSFDHAAPHDKAEVLAVSTVETADAVALPPDCSITDMRYRMGSSTGPAMLLAEECLLFSRMVPVHTDVQGLIDELGVTDTSAQGVLDLAERLTHHIFTTYQYDPDYSSVATPLDDVLAARRGVCQDFAHVAIAVCRRLGIPARYVSGYLETIPPPGVEKLRGADASHAWFAVYDGAGGWFDFDPTNDQRPNQQYVTTAWGRDYGDVAPLRGVVFGGGQQTLDVAVDVDRTPFPTQNDAVPTTAVNDDSQP